MQGELVLHYQPQTLGINISAGHLMEPGFAQRLSAQLERYPAVTPDRAQ